MAQTQHQSPLNLNTEQLKQQRHRIKKIFFLRICGMGMGTTATLLKEAGHEVAGCDIQFYPPMGEYLNKLQVTCYLQQEMTVELLRQYDLIVVGNSVAGQSKEMQLVNESGVSFCSFPAILGAYVLSGRDVIGVAGTHGKTTTTYYLVQVLTALGLAPGYLVGGVLPDRPASSLGTGKYFVIESDEYESSSFERFSKFRLYQLKKLLLMALEYDHADVFKSVADIQEQFRAITPHLEVIIYNAAYEGARQLISSEQQKGLAFKSYAYNDSQGQCGPRVVRAHEAGTVFELYWKGEWVTFETNILGPQNIQNLSAVLLFCLQENLELEAIRRAIKNLKQVKRRQEVRGQYGQLTVIDDFAHHPTSVELTLASIAQRFPGKPIHVVFEAITSTARSSAFQQEFARAFHLASSVSVVNPQVATNAQQFDNLNYSQLSADIAKQGIWSAEFKELAPLRQRIDQLAAPAAPHSILAVFSNRTVLGLWESDFVAQIKC